jgi:hypothetical protein
MNKMIDRGVWTFALVIAALSAPIVASADCVKGSDGSTICSGGSDGYYWQTRDFVDGSGYVFQDFGDGRSYYENWGPKQPVGSTGGNSSNGSNTSGTHLWDEVADCESDTL